MVINLLMSAALLWVLFLAGYGLTLAISLGLSVVSVLLGLFCVFIGYVALYVLKFVLFG